jgi:predicted O-methyltransferase YrrM
MFLASLKEEIMLQQTWRDVDAYFEARLIGEDAVLSAALSTCHAAGLPAIQVSAAQGKMLHLLALTLSARRILEVGTLGGYSGIWMARALPSDGQLVTLEIEPRHAEVARANFARANLAAQVQLRLGAALDTLGELRHEGGAPFDLIFIDADKPNNLRYVQAALELSRVGTLIVVDNVVRDGAILEPAHDAAVEAVRRMVDWFQTQRRVSATVLQTVGNKGYDGFLLARVQGAG